MDTDTDQTSGTEITSQQAEAPAPTDTAPMEASSEAPETSDSEESSETPKAEEKPPYQPNFKLKVYDEEKELDDPFLKALIKDAESEKKVKEIAQKYLGFDTVKARNEKTKAEYSEFKQVVQPVIEVYNKASTYLQKDDLEGFFDLLNIPDEKVFRYAIKKAEEANLDPAQRMQIQQQKEIARQREMLQIQNQDLQSQQQQQLAEFRAQELSWVLSRPDVQDVAKSFDERVGKPGAFRQAVIDKGLAHFAATNGREDLSPQQAVEEVMKLIGAVVRPSTPNAPMPASPLIQQNAPPPIIPNVVSKGASPVKKQVRSIEDLKKKQQELGNARS